VTKRSSSDLRWDYGGPGAEGVWRTVEKRFERSDWLQAIGGFLFFFAALLPWWEQKAMGLPARHNGFDLVLGVLAFIIFVGIGILTVIIKTDSLPLPQWLVDPTGVLVAAVIGSVLVAFAFVMDPFSSGANATRGIGLYLAAAAAVITLMGAVIGFGERHQRAAEGLDDEDEADDEYGYQDQYDGYDAEEQDDLIRRINSSLEKSPQRPAGDGGHLPPRRRSTRAEGRAATPRGRRAAGPPIP
jgi:hypothetical protein